jgi:AcrR family transcriptional regulator
MASMRDLQRAATESAILEAAWQRFARRGPDGTSIREVARDAGCNHALVARHFGSKDGLVDAVAQRLDQRVDAAVEAAQAGGSDPVVALLEVARRSPTCVKLLVRSGLGDLGEARCPAARHATPILAPTQPGARPGRRAALRSRHCTYGAASLLLGWLTFEDFVVAAARLEPVSGPRRDRAIAAAAEKVVGVARATTPSLTGALRVDRSLTGGGKHVASSAPRALVDSAVELFALRGPASVSVRDVGRHAGVNQGLIYRHFGSKEALLAAAFEQGASSLFPAALAPDAFDIDTVIHELHHGSRSPWLIARILVDDVDIADVRQRFPVVRRLVDGYARVPTGERGGDLTDPRVAVAAVTCMAAGSVIYGRDLREALDLPDDGSVEVAVADLCRVLLAEPLEPSGTVAGWR